jgi:hypothetical protein
MLKTIEEETERNIFSPAVTNIIKWIFQVIFLMLLFFEKYMKIKIGDANAQYVIVFLLAPYIIDIYNLFLRYSIENNINDYLILWNTTLMELQLSLFLYYEDSFYDKRNCYLLVPSYINILFILWSSYLQVGKFLRNASEVRLIIKLLLLFEEICFGLGIIIRSLNIYPFGSYFLFSMQLWVLIEFFVNGIDRHSKYKNSSKLSLILGRIFYVVLQFFLLLKIKNIIDDLFWWNVLIMGILLHLTINRIPSLIMELISANKVIQRLKKKENSK